MGKFWAIVKPVGLIYLTWCLVSLIFYYLGLVLPDNKTIMQLSEFASIIVFIFTASFTTIFFIIHIEKQIKEKPYIRTILLLFTILFFFGHYGLVNLTGVKNNILISLASINLIFFACIIGAWIITPLKRPAEIVPVCVVVAFADLFSVFSGPTRHFAGSISEYYKGGMQGAPPFVDFLLVKIISPAYKDLVPVFGVSDWIIIAFLSAAAVNFNMNDNLLGKNIEEIQKSPVYLFFPIASAGLITAILIARLADFFIPALPFVVIVFLVFMMIRYPEMRKLTKTELVPMVIFSSILMTLMILF